MSIYGTSLEDLISFMATLSGGTTPQRHLLETVKFLNTLEMFEQLSFFYMAYNRDCDTSISSFYNSLSVIRNVCLDKTLANILLTVQFLKTKIKCETTYEKVAVLKIKCFLLFKSLVFSEDLGRVHDVTTQAVEYLRRYTSLNTDDADYLILQENTRKLLLLAAKKFSSFCDDNIVFRDILLLDPRIIADQSPTSDGTSSSSSV